MAIKRPRRLRSLVVGAILAAALALPGIAECAAYDLAATAANVAFAHWNLLARTGADDNPSQTPAFQFVGEDQRAAVVLLDGRPADALASGGAAGAMAENEHAYIGLGGDAPEL